MCETMNVLSEDSIFGQIFGFLGNMIALNILWLVTSLPIVTIGASTTAMYYTALKLHKDKDVTVWKAFFHSFRQNFMQATAIWAVLAAVEALLLSYGFIGIGLITGVLLLYIFPVIAAFSNTLGKLAGHAFYFAFHKPGYLIATAALTCLPMYFTMVDAKLFPVYLLIWLMCGFSLTAYGNAWFYLRLFQPHLKECQKNTFI
ncbi:YesL family protein [Hungatella sp. L12]|uniref:YesL family protein n=2 Tax=Lachnospiraceae TaxID=186803 RepID=A0ABR7HCI6_9FIRM|nr:YesL family protein [Hungatella hominis]